MVSDNRRDPQRKSTRPVQGEAPQWRSTGAGGSQAPRRASGASGSQPTRRPLTQAGNAPGSIEPRAKGLRAYDEAGNMGVSSTTLRVR